MNLDLPFSTSIPKTRNPKKSKNLAKRSLIKIKSEHAPLEIQNMDMPQLEYLYENGTPAEQEIAEHVIRTRKKFETATMMPDDILASGSPNQGSPSSGALW